MLGTRYLVDSLSFDVVGDDFLLQVEPAPIVFTAVART